MKRSLQLIVLMVSVSSSVSVLASSAPTKAQLVAEISQVSKQTTALEQEVRELRAEVKSLRASKRAPANRRAATIQTRAAQQLPPPHKGHYPGDGHFKHKNYLNPNAPRAQDKYYMFHYGEGVTVITSPLMGLRTAFDASDLLEAKSTMNEDLSLLEQKRYLQNMLVRHGYSLGDRPIVVLSGGLEGQTLAAGGYWRTR